MSLLIRRLLNGVNENETSVDGVVLRNLTGNEPPMLRAQSKRKRRNSTGPTVRTSQKRFPRVLESASKSASDISAIQYESRWENGAEEDANEWIHPDVMGSLEQVSLFSLFSV